MKADEQFTFTINIFGKATLVEVETREQQPFDEVALDYCITLNGEKFVINPGTEEGQEWMLVRGKASDELVQAIGEAIEDHYL